MWIYWQDGCCLFSVWGVSMAEKDRRYYWLKLKRDFFKRHDIRIIESMPNGKDYILFYLKLLCESVDHEGNLRFSDQIPYNEDMLSTITNTNVDVVRSAIKIFSELDMMTIMDDGTYFMTQVEELVGSETYWAEKKRLQRQKELLLLDNVQQVSNESPTCPSKSKRKSKSKNKSNIFTPPTREDVQAYCKERGNHVDAERFVDYYASQKWKKANGQPVSDWKACVRTWERSETKRKGANGVILANEEDDTLDGIL